jgi:FkbM family methyltransferase
MRDTVVGIYVGMRKRLVGSKIGSIPGVTPLNNFLLSCMKKEFTMVRGKKMFLDKNDGLELSLNHIYEPMETTLIQNLVKPGNTVMDIGAHIGYYTLLLSELVGKEGRVYAFEPDAENFRLLEKNVRENGCNNVILVNDAISDHTGKLTLYSGEGGSANPTVGSTKGGVATEVHCIALDDFVGNFVDFIKMDIEGGEVAALRGMKKLIESNPWVKIITEFYPEGLERAGTCGMDLVIFLLARGFRLYKINEETGNLEADFVPSGDITNLLCVRGSL